MSNSIESLKKFKTLLDEGIINQEEFDLIKRELLEQDSSRISSSNAFAMTAIPSDPVQPVTFRADYKYANQKASGFHSKSHKTALIGIAAALLILAALIVLLVPKKEIRMIQGAYEISAYKSNGVYKEAMADWARLEIKGNKLTLTAYGSGFGTTYDSLSGKIRFEKDDIVPIGGANVHVFFYDLILDDGTTLKISFCQESEPAFLILWGNSYMDNDNYLFFEKK